MDLYLGLENSSKRDLPYIDWPCKPHNQKERGLRFGVNPFELLGHSSNHHLPSTPLHNPIPFHPSSRTRRRAFLSTKILSIGCFGRKYALQPTPEPAIHPSIHLHRQKKRKTVLLFQKKVTP
jgi:hypothetical protein